MTSIPDHSADWRSVREILYEHWDPLSVRGQPGTKDEYDAYVGEIIRIGQKGSVDELKNHLTSIENDQMGVRPDHIKNESTAAMIVAHLNRS